MVSLSTTNSSRSQDRHHENSEPVTSVYTTYNYKSLNLANITLWTNNINTLFPKICHVYEIYCKDIYIYIKYTQLTIQNKTKKSQIYTVTHVIVKVAVMSWRSCSPCYVRVWSRVWFANTTIRQHVLKGSKFKILEVGDNTIMIIQWVWKRRRKGLHCLEIGRLGTARGPLNTGEKAATLFTSPLP